MISKISFSKLVRDELRKLNWLLAVQMLVFGLLIPFRVLIELSVQRPRFFSEGVSLQEVFYSSIGLGHPENTMFILMAGVVCAISAFSYVHSAEKLDFFHSLPIKRERLFAAKYLGSVLTFAAAYILSQAAALVIGAAYGVCSAKIVFEMALATVEGILCFLCSYAGTLVAVMLTGKLLATFLAVGVLGAYFPLIWVLKIGMQELFYYTALASDMSGVNSTDILMCSSPWAFAAFHKRGMVKGITGTMPSLAGLCQLLAVAAVFSLLALALYRARKTEAAGNAIAFRKVEGIAKVLLMIPAALCAGVVAYASFYSPVWEFFFILFFGALGCMIIEFIYRSDIRQVLAHKSHMLITVVVASAVFFACRYDVTGFNTYLPEKDEVEAMAVYHYDMFGVENEGKDEHKVLDALAIEDFTPVYEMAKAGIEQTPSADWTDEREIKVKYCLKNGTSVYRRYRIDQELYYEKMDELQEQEAFRTLCYPILTWEDTQQISYLEFSVYTGDLEALGFSDTKVSDQEITDSNAAFTLHISGKDIDQVIGAYRKDLETVSYSELQGYEMCLSFYKKDGTSGGWYYVSDGCENTLKVIQEIFHRKTSGKTEGK